MFTRFIFSVYTCDTYGQFASNYFHHMVLYLGNLFILSLYFRHQESRFWRHIEQTFD